MKVLSISAYLSISGNNPFGKFKSGYGIMVQSIAQALGKEVDMYCTTPVLNQSEIHYGSFRILRHSTIDFLKGLRLRYIIKGMYFFLRYRLSIKERLHLAFVYFNLGAICNSLDIIKPDIVQIHGVLPNISEIIQACQNRNIRFLITLHGLLLDPSIKCPDYLKRKEQKLLELCAREQYPISVISTGILKRIQRCFNIPSIPNFNVVLNFTTIHEICKSNIHTTVLVTKFVQKRIILCIGTINENKNQMQLLKVIGLLPEDVKNEYHFVFIGNNLLEKEIAIEVKRLRIESNVSFRGFMTQDLLVGYYLQADYVILPSINEGFGLPIIEGFAFGVPAICFNDIDAIDDLYDENVMLLVRDRSDQALIEALLMANRKEWNREYICRYSKKFSSAEITKRYLDLYRKILE